MSLLHKTCSQLKRLAFLGRRKGIAHPVDRHLAGHWRCSPHSSTQMNAEGLGEWAGFSLKEDNSLNLMDHKAQRRSVGSYGFDGKREKQ